MQNKEVFFFFIADLCRNPNFHLSFRLSSSSSRRQKSSTAVNGTPPPPPIHPPRSSQKNPITAVFGDQQDYSVSKEKQSGPICCPSLAGVTSCNEVPDFCLPSLSPHLRLLLLFSISLPQPFLLVLVFLIFFFFFKLFFHLFPFPQPTSWCYSTTRL